MRKLLVLFCFGVVALASAQTLNLRAFSVGVRQAVTLQPGEKLYFGPLDHDDSLVNPLVS